MTDKRFYNGIELKKDLLWFKNIDHIPHITDIVLGYNTILEENEQLKRTISKIDFAIIRKYDNSLENLLDEVYDGEYNKWIKKQLSRAKKLDGDVE